MISDESTPRGNVEMHGCCALPVDEFFYPLGAIAVDIDLV